MAKNDRNPDPVVAELQAIKRLLVLYLMKVGTPQIEIAKALETDQSCISRTFRYGKVKPLSPY